MAGPQGTNAPQAVPSYVQFNAYRWLRDSGFSPSKFAASNATVAAESEVSGGLVKFSQWFAVYPGRDGLGVLSFGRHSAESWVFGVPVIVNRWFVVGVDAFIAISTIGGGVLVLRFRRRKAAIDLADGR